MKKLNYISLHAALQVDQQIAAGNQINPGKRRIREQIVGCKHHQVAYFFAYPESTILFLEETLQAFIADVGLDVPWIEAFSCFI